ncbi:Uncharacterised protein [Streptococcus pneumoniae]|nr:Uncharacterised protein [Streptococcus pneumoniae]
MTEKEFSQNLGIDIEIFEDGLFPDEAFFGKSVSLRLIGI